tara:strand:- start:737 stop:1405 length:669 start_codon:yes stop_codon:yes gene_type:complete
MPNFKFVHVNLPDLQRNTEKDGYRRYTTPEGNVYPSVTTIIDQYSDKTFLEDWKDRVGDEEAERIKNRSARRGKTLHKLCEHWLINDPIVPIMPTDIEAFSKIKPILDEHIDNIHGIEAPLYSDILKLAGTTDCIAGWDGVLSVIDFKTSIYQKHKEWIENYFMQTTIYGLMFEERTGIKVPQVVVIIVPEHDFPQVFVEPKRKFLKPTAKFLKEHMKNVAC